MRLLCIVFQSDVILFLTTHSDTQILAPIKDTLLSALSGHLILHFPNCRGLHSAGASLGEETYFNPHLYRIFDVLICGTLSSIS